MAVLVPTVSHKARIKGLQPNWFLYSSVAPTQRSHQVPDSSIGSAIFCLGIDSNQYDCELGHRGGIVQLFRWQREGSDRSSRGLLRSAVN